MHDFLGYHYLLLAVAAGMWRCRSFAVVEQLCGRRNSCRGTRVPPPPSHTLCLCPVGVLKLKVLYQACQSE
jgi:hypothetical protein